MIYDNLLPNQTDPTDFTVVEKWESQDALDAHLASETIQAAIAQRSVLFAKGTDIRRYTLLA